MLKLTCKVVTLGVTVLGLVLLLVKSSPAQGQRPLFPREFSEAAPQGFGDRQNSAAWSMKWWKGKLYVGTVRAWYCWIQAWASLIFPFNEYPPTLPDVECASDPLELPLQAEIWRYTPETGDWELVYQSPNNVEIPGHPGYYTSRDLGYRTMEIFREHDGTEALYVGGATVNLLWPQMPPPSILRSTDGVTFRPVPEDPGTLLGDLGQDQATFRDMEVYNGRLYVINGKIQGEGAVLEAEDPAGGNDNFRWVTPEGMSVFEMAPFNGFLYLGLANQGPDERGYAVVKTDATGNPPYDFTPVVTNGGFLRPFPSSSVVSMHVFKGRLYVGMNRPAELIRINPDDTWDLVIGKPREAPDGWRYPISGFGAGFDWPLNVHIWRMQEHEGALYVGTADDSTQWGGQLPSLDPILSHWYGFDLYSTSDGFNFNMITRNGFGDKFNHGARTFASCSPYGLFLGAVNYYYGLQIWKGVHEQEMNYFQSPESPEGLEVESKDGQIVLSWDPPLEATRFQIFRSDLRSSYPQFQEIGTSDQFTFIDNNGQPNKVYYYYVVAEDVFGYLSEPSNVVRAPSLLPPVTFSSLMDALIHWEGHPYELSHQLWESTNLIKSGRLDEALQKLEQTVPLLNDNPTLLDPWRAEDFQILVAKLMRRVRLAQVGIIDPADLL